MLMRSLIVLRTLLVFCTLMGSAGARAGDLWGCEVLLCLSNPAGPMAVAECVPPITRLYEALRRFEPFPTCDMASGPEGGSFAKMVVEWYDDCPTGLAPLANGVQAIQLSRAAFDDVRRSNPMLSGLDLQAETKSVIAAAQWSSGIGEGKDFVPDETGQRPSKTCVAGELGPVTIAMGGYIGSYEYAPASGIAFEQVRLVAPTMRQYIDVYVSGKRTKRVPL